MCPVPIGLKHVDRASFRHMVNYGGTTFIAMIAWRLRFKTDEVILGTMMSTVAVTWFNIGARIVDYSAEFVGSLAQVFVPMSSQSEATGNLDRLRKIYLAGNRACAFLIFPITAFLIILGKDIIRIWVGARYVPHCYPVLVVMIIPFALMLSQSASQRVLFGMGTHRTMAIVIAIEGVGQYHPQHRARSPAGNCGRRSGNGHPAQLHLSCIYASAYEETDRRSRWDFPARSLHAAHSFDPPAGRSAVVGQPIFLSPQPDPVGARSPAGEFDLQVGLFWAYRTNRAFHVAEIAGLTKPLPLEQPPQSVIAVEYQGDE